MKGKGKSKSNAKGKLGENTFSLRVSSFGISDISKETSTFSFDLLKKDCEHITLNDFKTTQFELENSLVSITKRKKQLENKIKKLEALQATKRKRSRSTDSVEKKNTEEKPPKKIKESTSKGHGASTSNQIKNKFIQPQIIDPFLEIPKVQKNDGPNRFWSYLEPYCADLTQDTIKTIEEWIREAKCIDQYLKIPEVGTHFASSWPISDMVEEIKEGSKSVENPKGLFTDSATDHAEVERILELGENECSSSEVDDQYACMADRLVYSLVEENLMTATDDTFNEACNDDILPKMKSNVSQPISSSKGNNIEKKLLMQFAEAGLLDDGCVKTNDTGDEISEELRRLQSLLVPLNEYNLFQTRKLLGLAKKELAQQEVRKRLQEVDIKVMEIYRTIAAARNNKTVNKKLEDQAKRILRERKKIIERLNNMENA